MCRIGITAEKKSRDSRMTLSIFIFDTYSILIINFIIQEPNDYDTWFDYLRMVEQEGDSEVIRDTYERAISNIPDSTVKNDWRRLVNVSNSIKRKNEITDKCVCKRFSSYLHSYCKQGPMEITFMKLSTKHLHKLCFGSNCCPEQPEADIFIGSVFC